MPKGIVGKNLLISSPGSLNNDGVDAQELCRVQYPIILLWYLWLEHVSGRPTNLLQLMGEGRAPSLERQVPASAECRLIDVGAIVPIGLVVVVAVSLDGDARTLPLLVLWGSPLVLTCSRIG